MTLQVAFAADEKYVPHAAAMMHSVAAQAPAGGAVFHFLHDAALPRATLATLTAFAARIGCRLQAHLIDDARTAGLPRMGRIPPVMWYRVYLPELLARESRVLYLDCDTLALAPLEPLWRTDLAGAWLGAVRNVFEPANAGHAARIGLAGGAYFNSGVLLMDLDAWRRERCAEAILALARNPDAGLVFPDQDALNRVFAGHWLALHPRWNCQNSVFFFRRAREVFGAAAVREALAAPGIVHFEGGHLAKPWHYLCRHPYRDAYFRCRAETPWPTPVIEGRSAFNRMLRPLPLFAQLALLRWTWGMRRALRGLQRAV